MAVNVCTNPALGANTTGWQDNSGGITRVTVTGFERPQAAEVTVPALDAFERRVISQTGAAVAGNTYTGSVSYRTDRDAPSLDVYLIFADAAGGLLQKSAHPSNPIGATANTVARAAVTATAPANTASIAMWVSLDNELVSTVMQVTAVRLEQGSITPHDYFDGESAGWQWDGVQFNSTSSEMAGQTIAIGQSSEVDTAGSVTPAKALSILQSEEADAASAIVPAKAQAVGLALQTETAGDISPSKRMAIERATETDLAQSISARSTKHVMIGQAVELNTSSSVTSAKRRSIGQAVEVNVAQAITASGGTIPVWPPTAGSPSLRSVGAGPFRLVRPVRSGQPSHEQITAGSPKLPR